jgi:LacI family transcriptional regulator
MAETAKTTVRSLAAELEISPITVSRALRGQPSVRPELADRIRSLAEARGYRSDPIVAEVMGGLGRTQGRRYRETVAFVWTHERSESGPEERGAAAAAEALGYRLEIVKPWTQGLAEKDVSRILWARGIRGVLLAPNYSWPDPRYELEWPRFASVLMGSSLVNTGLPRVARDYYHDAKLALGKLHEAGYSRIGMVLDTSMHERTERRYAAAFREYGHSRARLHLVELTNKESAEKLRWRRWLESAKPDAILTGISQPWQWGPLSLPQVRLMLRPGEKGVGVRADFARVGAEAMRILDGLLRENRLGLQEDPVSVLVPGVWTRRV